MNLPLIAALLLTFPALPCAAQAPLAGAHTTNAPVHTLLRHGARIYVGGEIGALGPAYGGAVATNAITGELSGFPNVAGTVRAIISDGNGGWYLGGDFVFVGGSSRVNIAHIDASHLVTAWAPAVNGTVTTLVASDSNVYIAAAIPGGNSALYKADRHSADVSRLAETTNGEIRALAVCGSRLYVAGDFRMLLRDTTYFESPGAAALDAATGDLIAGWSPGSDSEGQHSVEAIAANDSLVFVGGYFKSFGGQSRYSIAALDASNGNAVPWYSEDSLSTFRVRSLVLRDSTLYAGGNFLRLGNQNRQKLAALDIRTGLARDWNPGVSGECAHLSLAGSTLYCAGQFAPAAFDAMTGAPRDWHPPPSLSDYLTLAAADSIVYVGAGMNTFGASIRNRLGALDAQIGIVEPWTANSEGTIKAFAVSGSVVYVGGNFRRINGEVRNHVAALDIATGALTAWNPDADNDVEAIAVSGGTVYLGGDFTQIQGQFRSRIAAVDTATGGLLPWNPSVDATVHALITTGGTVYAGGNFSVAGGQLRSRLAAIDSAGGAVLDWNPSPNNDVYALAARGPLLYVCGRFSRVGEIKRGRMAAIDLISGVPTMFDPKASGPVRSFALSANTAYLGGEFDLVSDESRSRIAAVDIATGALRSWNPGLNGTIRAVAFGDNVVFAGGDFELNGNLPRSYLAVLPDERATATLVTLLQLEISNEGVVIRWRLADEQWSTRCQIEKAATPEGTWSALVTEPEHRGSDWTVIDREQSPGRSCWYRLVINDADRTWISNPLEASASHPVVGLALSNVSPIPSNGHLTISFDLPRECEMTLTLLDLQGRIAARIASGRRSAGRHRVEWSGAALRNVPGSGIYFIRLQAAGKSIARRCVIAL